MHLHSITGKQLKEARVALGLSQGKLAALSGINRVSVRVYEACGPGQPNGYSHVITRLVRCLEGEGIEFLDDGTVRLQRPATSTVIPQRGHSMKDEALIDAIFDARASQDATEGLL